MMMFDEDTLDAVWCWDSETGEEFLLDRKTGTIIGRRLHGQLIDPEIYD